MDDLPGAEPRRRLDLVHDATTRYLQDLDGLTADQLAGPSTLPGWSRAHVVAHVAGNALGLARALEGLVRETPVPVYDDRAARDAEIEELAQLTAQELREATLDAAGRFREAAEVALADPGGARLFPDMPELSVPDLLTLRWREVEIHHADLDTGYRPQDWPEEFLDHAFNLVVHDRQDGPSMMLRTPDGEVLIGNGYGPVVTGTRADLAWWLLGRGEGEHLSSSEELPTLGPWIRRTPAR